MNTECEEALAALSMKQRLFVEAYFACEYVASDAVTRAGYNTKYPNKLGYQLLNTPKVKKAIDLLGAKKIDEVSVSQEYVLRKLIKTVEKAEKDNNHGATLRGLELLAKHLGMFIDRTEITGKDGEAIQLEKVNNDAADFARSIARIAKRGGEAGSPGESTH